MKGTILAIASAVVFAGCAGSPYAESKKYDRLREYAGADFGYAVMSVGHLKSSPFTVTSITFRAKGTDDRGAFSYAPKYFVPSPRDFVNSEAEGTLAIIKLPPGEYEIYGASGGWGAGTYRFSAGTPILPPMIFTIQSGQTAYVGRFVIGYNGRGESPPANLQISDELSADLATAGARDKSMPIGRTHSFLPSQERRKQ